MLINEKWFNIGLGLVVACLVGFLLSIGSIDKNSVLGMIAAIGFNVVLFLSAGFGLQYFQLGIGTNIQEEIYDEGNIAASIYQGAIWIGLAIVIAKGVM